MGAPEPVPDRVADLRRFFEPPDGYEEPWRHLDHDEHRLVPDGPGCGPALIAAALVGVPALVALIGALST